MVRPSSADLQPRHAANPLVAASSLVRASAGSLSQKQAERSPSENLPILGSLRHGGELIAHLLPEPTLNLLKPPTYDSPNWPKKRVRMARFERVTHKLELLVQCYEVLSGDIVSYLGECAAFGIRLDFPHIPIQCSVEMSEGLRLSQPQERDTR